MVINWERCFNKYSNNCEIQFIFFKGIDNGNIVFKVIKKRRNIFKTRLKINRVFQFFVLYRKINIILKREFPITIIDGIAYITESQLNDL